MVVFCNPLFYIRGFLKKLEATGGFGPPNRGFADPRLNHLATSPSSALLFYSKIKNDAIFWFYASGKILTSPLTPLQPALLN
jgi:hypothetical protein